MHGAVVAFHRRRLVGHGDQAARVAQHEAMEVGVGGEQIGSATDHAHGNAMGVGVFHLFDDADTGCGFYEMIDIATNCNSGEFSECCHTAHSNKKPDRVVGF